MDIKNCTIVHDGDKISLISKEAPKPAPPLAPTCPPELENWKPQQHQIAWFQRMIGLMRDGGIWQVPASGAQYRVSLTDKTFVLIKGKIDEWHWMNVKTLAKLGYKVFVSVELSTGAGKSYSTGA